jgi:hypothetical protein
MDAADWVLSLSGWRIAAMSLCGSAASCCTALLRSCAAAVTASMGLSPGSVSVLGCQDKVSVTRVLDVLGTNTLKQR